MPSLSHHVHHSVGDLTSNSTKKTTVSVRFRSGSLKIYVERRLVARTLFNAFYTFKTLFRSARASVLKETLADKNQTETVNVRVSARGASLYSIGSIGDFGAKTTVSVRN